MGQNRTEPRSVPSSIATKDRRGSGSTPSRNRYADLAKRPGPKAFATSASTAAASPRASCRISQDGLFGEDMRRDLSRAKRQRKRYQYGDGSALPSISAKRRKVPRVASSGGAAGLAQMISTISALGRKSITAPGTR